MSVAEEVISLFEEHGHDAYFGEDVSQLEHALQAAYFAGRSGAEEHLIIAALLHDVGHLLHGLPENIAEAGVDGHHELVGNRWLAKRFGENVTEPVRLHVAAKRYLCRVEPKYLAHLSPSSVQSLGLQGGAFSSEEATAFERNPHFEDAVKLRRWDDEAKIPEMAVPAIEEYREMIERIHRDSAD